MFISGCYLEEMDGNCEGFAGNTEKDFLSPNVCNFIAVIPVVLS